MHPTLVQGGASCNPFLEEVECACFCRGSHQGGALGKNRGIRQAGGRVGLDEGADAHPRLLQFGPHARGDGYGTGGIAVHADAIGVQGNN